MQIRNRAELRAKENIPRCDNGKKTKQQKGLGERSIPLLETQTLIETKKWMLK